MTLVTIAEVRVARSRHGSDAEAAAWVEAQGFSAHAPEHTESEYVWRQTADVEGKGTPWPLADGAVAVMARRAEIPPRRVLVHGKVRAEDLVDLADLVRSWEIAARKPNEKAMRAGYLDRAADLGMRLPFNVSEDRVSLFLRDRTAGKVTTIAETMLDTLRRTIEQSMERQETVQELAGAIRDTFEDGSAAWASRIARTETGGLYTQAGIWAMKDGGIQQKEWLSSRDGLVRPSHVAADGQRVGIDEDFTLEGGTGPGPGLISSAAESVNCRCTTLPVLTLDDDETVSRADRWAAHEERLVAAESAMAAAWMRMFDDAKDAILTKLEAMPL